MSGWSKLGCATAIVALVLVACQPAGPTPRPSGAASGTQAQAGQAAGRTGGPTRVVIGVTETIESQNPYADSISLGYGIWCEVLGCLVTMDPQTNTYKPELAESWEVENPTTWVFHLRKD